MANEVGSFLFTAALVTRYARPVTSAHSHLNRTVILGRSFVY